MSKTKPTPTMLRVLRDIIAGRGTHHQCRGRAQHGGRQLVLWALNQHGLMDSDYKATEAGRELVRQMQRREERS